MYNKRRQLFITLLLMLSFSFTVTAQQGIDEAKMETYYQEQLVFVGTYTRQRGEGIYTLKLDSITGSLKLVTVNRVKDNPSWLALHPNGEYLYTINEVNQYQKVQQGYVSSFRIEDGGRLHPLNEQGTKGRGPCYVSVDRTGSYVLVANYVGGSFTVIPILEDGGLGIASDYIVHESKPDGTKSNGHSILVDLDNRYVFAADLGLDKLVGFQLDLENGQLVPVESLTHQFPKGTGPRHLAFHPTGQFLYVINELASSITAFKFSSESTHIEEIGTVSTLPVGYSYSNFAADIHIHPSGRFLYGSNRGYDSIVAFAVDENSGALTPIDQRRTGKTPRGFSLDVTGRFLLVASQDSATVTVYPIHQQTGRIGEPVSVVSIPSPVNIVTMTNNINQEQ